MPLTKQVTFFFVLAFTCPVKTFLLPPNKFTTELGKYIIKSLYMMDAQICLEIFDIRILEHESIIQMQQMRITCHHGGCKQNLGGGRPSLFKLPKVAPTVGAIYQAGGQYRSHAYGLSGKPHMHTKNWFLLYTSIYKITLPTY